jgi:hypothetical protein
VKNSDFSLKKLLISKLGFTVDETIHADTAKLLQIRSISFFFIIFSNKKKCFNSELSKIPIFELELPMSMQRFIILNYK